MNRAGDCGQGDGKIRRSLLSHQFAMQGNLRHDHFMTQVMRLQFFERVFPSANMVLIAGANPVLVDSGYGSDLALTEDLLRRAGAPPESLSLIVNTHYHSDHVGGNHGLQTRYGLPIATYHSEAEVVNRRDAQACSARWLDQPVEPYQVDRSLADGDEIDTGDVVLQVLHVRGHTAGHIALYEPNDGVLITGDALEPHDVGWINPCSRGTRRA